MFKKFGYLAAFAAALSLAACKQAEQQPAPVATEVVNVPADEAAAAREEVKTQSRDSLPTPAKK